jgi:hypothetical protein
VLEGESGRPTTGPTREAFIETTTIVVVFHLLASLTGRKGHGRTSLWSPGAKRCRIDTASVNLIQARRETEFPNLITSYP